MEKSRIDWVVTVNTMIIDGDQIKPQIFLLKNGKEIHSALFAYGNGLVHGTNVNGNDFKFNIKELAEIRPLKNWPLPAKRKIANSTNTENNGDTTAESAGFETVTGAQVEKSEENFDHPLLQAQPTGTESNTFC